MGWNTLDLRAPSCPLFAGLPADPAVYFVHSYFPQPTDPRSSRRRPTTPTPFTAAVWKDNVFATQFHPEKSQRVGLADAPQLRDDVTRPPSLPRPPQWSALMLALRLSAAAVLAALLTGFGAAENPKAEPPKKDEPKKDPAAALKARLKKHEDDIARTRAAMLTEIEAEEKKLEEAIKQAKTDHADAIKQKDFDAANKASKRSPRRGPTSTRFSACDSTSKLASACRTRRPRPRRATSGSDCGCLRRTRW